MCNPVDGIAECKHAKKVQWKNPNGVYHGVYCYSHGRPYHGHVWMIRNLL